MLVYVNTAPVKTHNYVFKNGLVENLFESLCPLHLAKLFYAKPRLGLLASVKQPVFTKGDSLSV